MVSDVAMKAGNEVYWVVEPRAKDWPLVWKTVSESTRAVFRFCCAPRSLADLLVPRNVGIAMARRIATISNTTMSWRKGEPLIRHFLMMGGTGDFHEYSHRHE